MLDSDSLLYRTSKQTDINISVLAAELLEARAVIELVLAVPFMCSEEFIERAKKAVGRA